MKSEKNSGHCLGFVRLASIDLGFDIRLQRQAVALPEGPEADARMADTDGSADQTGVGYDAKDGRRQMWGTRDEVARELARAGYIVVAAKTPNGREVRCEPKNPKVFVCQPPTDNYWKEFPTIGAALAQFA